MPPDGRIVLVIEADHRARDETADGLRRLGLVAIPVADTASATVVIRSVRPDLVLWQGATGEAADLAAIAEWRERWSRVPILAVVAEPGSGADWLGHAGADTVLSGPAAREAVERRVLHLLGVRASGHDA